jgi:hypothetical protein
VKRFLVVLLLLAPPAFAQQGPTVTYPPLLLRDEGVDKGRLTKALDFVGAAVTCTFTAGVGTCTITAGGGSVTITEIEVTFPDPQPPRREYVFTVTDATVSGTSKILLSATKAGTGRNADEMEMDALACSTTPAAGSFTLYCTATPGPVAGAYKIAYTVG